MGLFSRLHTGIRSNAAPMETRAENPGQEALRLIDEGNALEEAGQPEAALERYNAAILASPGTSRAHLNRGNALLGLGNPPGALEAYAAAIACEPHYFGAHCNIGNAYLSAGDYPNALAAYRKALAIKPDLAEAEVGQGIALEALGQATDAIECYRRAIENNPDDFAARMLLGKALRHQGSLDEATASFRRALQIDSDAATAHFELGIALQALGRLEDAAASYRRALDSEPALAEASGNLGNVLKLLGRLDEAAACYRRAIAGNPRLAGVHSNLGNVLMMLGHVQDAMGSYRAALALAPDFVEAHFNLGNALKDVGEYHEAHASYRRAVELRPEFAEAHCNLGASLSAAGDYGAAIASFRRAVQLRPDSFHAQFNLGICLQVVGAPQEAITSLRAALRLQPDSCEVATNLGNALQDLGQLEEAAAAHRRALESNPDYAEAHNNLGNVMKELGRLDLAVASYRRAVQLKADFSVAHSNVLFAMNYGSAFAIEECVAEAQRYGKLQAGGRAPRSEAQPIPESPPRLRVGMVSGDLRAHPVGYFLQGLLARCDRTQLELVAYPTYERADAIAANLRSHFGRWKPLTGLSDQAAGEMIRADGIHILIDLSGHTARNRLPLFGLRPAPVQVSWLGYFATTGVSQIDYLLGDPYVTPTGEEFHFTEQVWRLPECYLCFTPPDIALDVGPLPAQTMGRVTFGSFNNLAKLNDSVVNLWARVLLAVPGSRLLLKTAQLNDPAARAATGERFLKAGIAPERLMLEGSSPRPELLAAYHRVDIGLDPFPYPGGTTTAEALWMGVPVITRCGSRFLSHVGESVAHNSGQSDWVATDDDDYVAKATVFAADLDHLAALRGGLRRRVLGAPLFDASRFARHFEAAMWGIWQSRQARKGRSE